MKSLLLIASLALPALPVWAETCPARDRSQERAQLLDALKSTPTEQTGIAAAAAVWAFWTRAPDAKAQVMLDRAMEQRLSFEYAGSEGDLSALVAYCPAFAEGWNQRAFTRFLREDFEGSLSDIAKTLELEPNHFGALAGRAQIYYRQGRTGLAQIDLRRALEVHPWMQERALIADQGEDI